jgi:hypothetical protein
MVRHDIFQSFFMKYLDYAAEEQRGRHPVNSGANGARHYEWMIITEWCSGLLHYSVSPFVQNSAPFLAGAQFQRNGPVVKMARRKNYLP